MPTRHKYIWDNGKKKAFPKFFKEHVQDTLSKTVLEGRRDNPGFFRVWDIWRHFRR